MDENTKYGLLKYSSMNIGDEIQSIAAKRFIPRVDKYIHRERTNEVKSKTKIKLIMNAWWLWHEKNFPPSNSIEPLLISIFFRKEIRENLIKGDRKDYLKKNGPVGCRDLSTLDFLKSNGIPSYFSGCLTLTMLKNKNIKRSNFILVVDMPKKFIKEVQSRTERPVYSVSRILSPCFTSKDRIELSKAMLYLYHTAHVVISPCLHVVLPCLAFETPVLRIDEGGDGRMDATARFAGYRDYCNTLTLDEFMADKEIYNLENPLKNPGNHLDIRNDLIEKCSCFTGFVSEQPTLDDDYNPIISLIKILKYDRKVIKRSLYWAKKKDLLRVFIGKTFLRRTKHDVKY